MDRSVVAMLVEGFQHAPINAPMQISSVLINERLPPEFLATLDSDQDRLDVLRACLIISMLTDGRVIPRVFQFKASLAMLHRRHCVMIASTSSGKTICLLIPLLLRPDSISITTSPLIRLQITQVCQLCNVYDIRYALP
ncbi:hypothetical protein J3R83DRAFT_5534 [Lanmaoa asiatica]|nr:hypothetical protein J3R83DRAFT_5534 [Lanmaoa asiatica]